MMNVKVRDLFVAVVTRKMKEENKTTDEVMVMYPKLSEADKTEIKNVISAQ